MSDNDSDLAMRLTAFARVRKLSEVRDPPTAHDLATGFQFEGVRIPLVNPQRGIFKPTQMRYLLSIKTVFPKPGGRVWYDDQREVHGQIFAGVDTIEYAFMGNDPGAADNRWLREAFENRVPVIYFLGIAPGRYQAFVPVFITGWDAKSLKAEIAFGLPEAQGLAPPQNEIERRYALRTVKQRLHQASFREAVMQAYGRRCAVSGLPESRLLDAHCIRFATARRNGIGRPPRDSARRVRVTPLTRRCRACAGARTARPTKNSHAVVPNGIPMSKIHHAALDAHLIGIDPDYRLHVSPQLLDQNDGPMLEGLKRLQGVSVHLPRREKDYPDRDRLSLRFERFRAAY